MGLNATVLKTTADGSRAAPAGVLTDGSHNGVLVQGDKLLLVGDYGAQVAVR